MVDKTLIVVDELNDLPELEQVEVLSFNQYLTLYPKHNEPKTRIINLCDTQRYLSKGYYCSLLAEAREHKVLPSVHTINQLRDVKPHYSILGLSTADLSTLKAAGLPSTHWIFFGWTPTTALKRIAKKAFEAFPAPILALKLWEDEEGYHWDLSRVALHALSDDCKLHLLEQLREFTQSVWRTRAQRKNHRWELAILVNPEESDPPSNRAAIARFVKAAAKLGIRAEAIEAKDLNNLSQYDALFIRETTAIDHHTFQLAARAEALGLIVMDDPTSIMRCCNKVYLHDAFTYKNIPSPATQVVTDSTEATVNTLETLFPYPMVLKMPEGSFSKGVFKVANRQALQDKLNILFQDSALVLVQEFLYTEFDWRIGVLNGRAIYACRYHMAKDHWQIYNHANKRHNSGDFDTLPTFEVPKRVLDAAVKAAKMVGNGLYGVDLKQKDHKVYVIEVNDNPNIDHKIEDSYMGDELYMVIMSEFQQRLEDRGRR